MGWKDVTKNVELNELRDYLYKELQMSSYKFKGIDIQKDKLIVTTKTTVFLVRKNQKDNSKLQVKSYTPTTIFSLVFFIPVYILRRIKQSQETKYLTGLIENYT